MHIDQLDLTQLRLLEALAATGSVSAASHRIGLSQSAASHALTRLRATVEDPVYVRTSDGMRPTPYGERLANAVTDALQRLRAGLADDPPFDPRTTERLFSIYLSDIGQMVMLPRLLAHMGTRAPGARIDVPPVPLDRPHEALEAGTVDLAVGYFPSLAAGFRKARLFREHYVCVARRDHRSFVDGMTLERFVEARHAIAGASAMAHDLLERALRRAGVRRLVMLQVPQFMVLPLVIANSDLLVTMPAKLAEQFASLARLAVMPLPVPAERYDIAVYWHERRQRDPSNRWLRLSLVELFQEARGGRAEG